MKIYGVIRCMQTTVAELERQLAASRAQVKTAEKDREEVIFSEHTIIVFILN